jgi:hypothetical protein
MNNNPIVNAKIPYINSNKLMCILGLDNIIEFMESEIIKTVHIISTNIIFFKVEISEL